MGKLGWDFFRDGGSNKYKNLRDGLNFFISETLIPEKTFIQLIMRKGQIFFASFYSMNQMKFKQRICSKTTSILLSLTVDFCNFEQKPLSIYTRRGQTAAC
jgi:hypothetical protein